MFFTGSLYQSSATPTSSNPSTGARSKAKLLLTSYSSNSSSCSSSSSQSPSPALSVTTTTTNASITTTNIHNTLATPPAAFQTAVITSNRSRRGRPPSIPDEHNMSRNANSGRTDKAHHKCPHCPQIYYGYHAMRDHITSVHLNSGEKYICHLCNKEYTWRITLRKHLKCQHGVHPDQM